MRIFCGAPAAAASIRGEDTCPEVHGCVKFIPQCDGTLVIAEIYGLPDSETGFFGFHIHEGGNCGGTGFSDTGSHYNPGNTSHPRHAGDLPPLLSSSGRAYMAVETNRFRLSDIIGRTVVIHSHPDDFRTQPSGDSGSKIACGVIRRV